MPLIWVHVFRYAPLTLLVPGQISLKVPAGVAANIAYGDLVCAIAALAAIMFLKFRWQGAVAVARTAVRSIIASPVAFSRTMAQGPVRDCQGVASVAQVLGAT